MAHSAAAAVIAASDALANSTYAFVYAAEIGIGCGFIKVTDGAIVGADYSGGTYSGAAFFEPDGSALLSIRIDYPVGVSPVSGGSAQEVPHARDFKLKLPLDFDNGKPFAVDTPGRTNVMMHRIHSAGSLAHASACATNGFKIVPNA